MFNYVADNMLENIATANDDNRIHQQYFNLIASERIQDVITRCVDNLIARHVITNMGKKLRLQNVGQLINEFKFPSNDTVGAVCAKILESIGPVLKALIKRKNLTYGHSYRDGFFLSTNRLITTKIMTTKMIKDGLRSNIKVEINQMNNEPNIFLEIKKIIHPKEREIQYLEAHGAILNNLRLFEMKLKDSPLCPLCNLTQDNEHIFKNYTNAIAMNKVLDKYKDSDPTIKRNINAIGKRFLFLNKDKKLTSGVIEIIFQQ